MCKLLIPVTNNEFKHEVDIRFNNILDGFDLFQNFTIASNNMDNGELKFIKFIEKVFEENNNKGYVDFYINKLSDKDKNNLITLVPDEDKEILKFHLKETHDGVFYKLENKNLIPFLVRLSTREILFITFYFTKKPITIWGNYGMKFPCFLKSKEDFKYYYKLAKELELTSVDE